MVEYATFSGCRLEVSKYVAEKVGVEGRLRSGCRVTIAKKCRSSPSLSPIIHSEFFQNDADCDRRFAQIKRKC